MGRELLTQAEAMGGLEREGEGEDGGWFGYCRIDICWLSVQKKRGRGRLRISNEKEVTELVSERERGDGHVLLFGGCCQRQIAAKQQQ